MTKQEEIREGLDNSICDACEEDVDKDDCRKSICAYASKLRDAILKLEDSQGVVIKVDRELPESPDADYLISQYEGEEATAEDVALMHFNGIEKGKRLMLRAGYVAVESLI